MSGDGGHNGGHNPLWSLPFAAEPGSVDDLPRTIGAADVVVEELRAAEVLAARAGGADPSTCVAVSAVAVESAAATEPAGVGHFRLSALLTGAATPMMAVPRPALFALGVRMIVQRSHVAPDALGPHTQPVVGWSVAWDGDPVESSIGVLASPVRTLTKVEAQEVATLARLHRRENVVVTPLWAPGWTP